MWVNAMNVGKCHECVEMAQKHIVLLKCDKMAHAQNLKIFDLNCVGHGNYVQSVTHFMCQTRQNYQNTCV